MSKEWNKAVDPGHYKGLLPSLNPNEGPWQYIEMMEYLLADFDGYEGHLAGQTYKYLMRLGKKDAKIQDASKALWYLQKLVDYYEAQEEE